MYPDSAGTEDAAEHCHFLAEFQPAGRIPCSSRAAVRVTLCCTIKLSFVGGMRERERERRGEVRRCSENNGILRLETARPWSSDGAVEVEAPRRHAAVPCRSRSRSMYPIRKQLLLRLSRRLVRDRNRTHFVQINVARASASVRPRRQPSASCPGSLPSHHADCSSLYVSRTSVHIFFSRIPSCIAWRNPLVYLAFQRKSRHSASVAT